MNKTLENSLDIETRNQARAELAFGMVADAYPIVAEQYNLAGTAHFGGAYLHGEPSRNIQTQHTHFQSMSNDGGR
ncbi:MAG: hypothetical protein J6V53_00970 [Alphaproteobacteria bacterium]|nr:hypothetical protein [Alphaproteobacteria bacterium]